MEIDFQAKLEQLFETRLRSDGKRFTLADIASRSSRLGFPLSVTYLSHLRTGRAKKPSYQSVRGIAAAFGVETSYFEDDDARTRALGSLQNGTSISEVSYRLNGLSPDDIDTITELIRGFRKIRGLPPD